MKPNKNVNPFDDLLMAYVIKESQANPLQMSADKETEIIFSKQYAATLPKEKVDRLLSTLAQSLSKDTLGILVGKALAEKNTSVSELQNQTGLTPSLLQDIKTDMVFTNSIPVRSLVKLLKFLGVSLENAKAAIDATFEKLSTESKMFLSIPANAQPAFRKGAGRKDSNLDLKRLKSDESYLYQNKEALDKYTRRLAELYNEI